MEPTTVVSTAIIAAISAGVTGGVTAVGKQAILDEYAALKKGIKVRIGRESKSAKAIQELEDNPDSKGRLLVLDESVEAEKVDLDPQIQKMVQALIEALSESYSGQQALAKYQVDAKGAMYDTIVGDNSIIHGLG
jgi:hypothetical protein